ncbi:hypothetical protein DTO212C5_7409 [Paecilomyces variotii]|nr:hypothetical protein DTO212C5_7409 [Paecilomyces variotii]
MIAWHPLLTYQRIQHYATELEARSGTQRIWGFINGTFRPVCRPSQNQRFYYSGYKKLHGFKYQGIITPDGMLLSYMGPFEGKVNDLTMIRKTGLEQQLQDMLADRKDYFLYGDSAYEYAYCCIAPFKRIRALTAEEERFNQKLSSDRISVEMVFGTVQTLWHTNALDVNLQPIKQAVASCYAISVFLTNIMTCLRGNVVNIRYQIEPPTLDEYLNTQSLSREATPSSDGGLGLPLLDENTLLLPLDEEETPLPEEDLDLPTLNELFTASLD